MDVNLTGYRTESCISPIVGKKNHKIQIMG
jgi:hypothetical protein